MFEEDKSSFSEIHIEPDRNREVGQLYQAIKRKLSSKNKNGYF
jgi:hypothetical protein